MELDPQTALSVYNAAVRTPLLYGCLSVKLLKTTLKSMDKQHAKQIKCTWPKSESFPHNSLTGGVEYRECFSDHF